jgi:putative phosphoribosyl transferase
MGSNMRRFRDREEAGRALAGRLRRYQSERPVVLALPRGGVPVAYPIAVDLHAPLEVLPVRKLGAPDQRELGVGAIALGGPPVFDRGRIEELGISVESLNAIEAEERLELDRQRELFCGARAATVLRGRSAIIVDDGLATGVSALAAVQAVEAQGPLRVILAVPVGASETVEALLPRVDDLVCLVTPRAFQAVGFWYVDFRPTDDEQVLELLQRAGAAPAAPQS